MKIIRKKLSPDEINASASAYYDDCSCYKTIPPGGGTPYANPAADPRSNAWALLPARTGSDIPCNAAANMVDKLKSMVAQAVGGLDQFQIATGLLEVLLVVFGVATGGLGDLLIAGGELFITIGVDTISTAFTDDQWQLILCILLDNVNPDGSVSPGGDTTILSEIATQCNSTVYDVMIVCIGSLGYVGLSNAGASGDVSGDCAACGEWCYRFNFTVDDGGWSGVAGSVYTPGVGWVSDDHFASPNAYVYTDATITFSSTEIVYAKITFDFSAGIQSCPDEAVVGLWSGNFATPLILFTEPDSPGSPQEWSGSTTTGQLVFQLQPGCRISSSTPPGGSATMLQIEVHGTGSNPFGADNCVA